MVSIRTFLKQPRRNQLVFYILPAGFAALGIVTILLTRAATPSLSLEPEAGTRANGATVITDMSASGGEATEFAAPTSTPPITTVKPVWLANASKTTIGGETYTAQSPDKPYSMAVDADPSPTYARFELRDGDRWINDINKYPNDKRERAELRGNTYWPLNTDIWMSGALRVTAGSWKPGEYNIVTQFFQVPPAGEAAGENPLTLNIIDGTMHVFTRGDTSVSTTTRPPDISRFSRDWSSYNGKWANFVIRARFSKTAADGQLQVWLDGMQVANLSGIVMGFNNPQGPYAKMGIYRSNWTDPIVVEWANREVGTTDLSTRITKPLPTPN